jgi:crotonobetainyl-CoA:carnitine CoA-transferase CaiB-like acyl-CoA transferase
VFADPQVKHLGCAVALSHPTLGELKVVGQPVVLSRTPAGMARATPEPGEHTEEIMGELGYSLGDVRALRDKGVL